MKTLLAGAIALVAATAAVPVAYPSLVFHEELQLQREVLNATVRVEVRNASGAMQGSGSGTALSPRHILTNWHVIASAQDGGVTVRGWVREGGRVLPVIYAAKVIASDQDRDLALLELDADWIGAIGVLADTEPQETATVCKSGSAHGKRPRVACGPYSGHDETPSGTITHVSSGAATAPGDSGGGVWSSHEGGYRIIAVTRAVPVFPMGLGASLITTTGLAISLHDVRAFLGEHMNVDASAD